MAEPKYRTVNVDPETFRKLGALTNRSYRNLSAEVRYLVDREYANVITDNAAQVAALNPSCEDAK